MRKIFTWPDKVQQYKLYVAIWNKFEHFGGKNHFQIILVILRGDPTIHTCTHTRTPIFAAFVEKATETKRACTFFLSISLIVWPDTSILPYKAPYFDGNLTAWKDRRRIALSHLTKYGKKSFLGLKKLRDGFPGLCCHLSDCLSAPRSYANEPWLDCFLIV